MSRAYKGLKSAIFSWQVANEVSMCAITSPELALSFGSYKNLKKNINSMIKRDRDFLAKSGLFMDKYSAPETTLNEYNSIHVNEYRAHARPSLPCLALHLAKKHNISKDSEGFRAMMLLSIRAEKDLIDTPPYHNRNHFSDVVAITSALLELNESLKANKDPRYITLSEREKALMLALAFGHDIDHNGQNNPKNDHYHNELKSFKIMKPLLLEAGYSAQEVDNAELIIKTTSPNGPHLILKRIAYNHRNNIQCPWHAIDTQKRFIDLKPLYSQPKLTQMAAMLSDADLYPSAGAGLQSNKVMSLALSLEQNKNLTGPKARRDFLDLFIGPDGFTSYSGRILANDSFKRMRRFTLSELSGGNINKNGTSP